MIPGASIPILKRKHVAEYFPTYAREFQQSRPRYRHRVTSSNSTPPRVVAGHFAIALAMDTVLEVEVRNIEFDVAVIP
jgi:hypothetical protein